MIEILKHINNALKEELEDFSTVAKFATIQLEGSRKVERNIDFYNLDMILSVGYRVKSKRGIQFRVYDSAMVTMNENAAANSNVANVEVKTRTTIKKQYKSI